MIYWGYLHTNGTLQIKTLFGNNYNYAIEDSQNVNSFVAFVFDPVETTNGLIAREMFIDQLRKKGYENTRVNQYGEKIYQKINTKYR